ncbi:MAG: PP2C family serine/threonine-protein phosphatase [Acidobacteriota bacterium]
MAQYSLEVGFSTDVGRQRRRNEDSYAVFVPYPGEGNPSQLAGLLLVADGMGGERAGDRASQLTAKRLRHWFSTGIFCSWPQFSGDKPLQAALAHAIRTVSSEIFELGENDPSIRGLGSTVVMGAMTRRQIVFAHVGDSRAYLVREGQIHLLTSDHSWVQRQVDAGVLSAEDARTHPQRNILTRSLGDAIPPEVDVTTVELQDRDLFLLCSDGLTGGVTDQELLTLASQISEPQPLAEALVRVANEKDGSDNITAVVGVCRQEDLTTRADFENHATHQIVLKDDTVDIYDGDTEVDIPRPSARQLRDVDSPSDARGPSSPAPATTWRTWLTATLVAATLGLLASYLVEHSRSDGPARLEDPRSLTSSQ